MMIFVFGNNQLYNAVNTIFRYVIIDGKIHRGVNMKIEE